MPNSFPQAELEQATGSAPVAWEAVASRGYGRINAHWRVQLADGRRAFVKVALDELAAGWLRDEHRIYAAVTGSFLPALLGWYDEHTTLLAIEDLGDAFWPPPWTDERIAAVRRALAELHAKPAPPGTPALESIRETFAGWPLVADDTRPLLSTGLCTREWLEAALPVLLEVAAAVDLGGGALLHLDVRSDNLCFVGNEVKLVDWNLAHVGNPIVDEAFWLPSLRLEGGPEPWELLPETGGVSALVAGFFAARAGLAPPAGAPTVREFQRRQAAVALPWAARELGLPRPH
ncbi:MAG TPA: hypothetical protein VEL10_06575 [Gaiellaceae bacterium]|nr:hypothetical protein [Gaiellaceae bacterium]